ncbi:MAG TPA: hypothetical protein PLX54_00105 [Candidatus Fermentibacter daniensis]|nr:hypothetical protein [Candidatus Fermentibacter daniensis]HOR06530.1 hypothetical protein [Candidatus Fermentibacter daniensis]HPK50759.1 hypothetical protein [Candidatus Fermentibacter daniensis]
MRVALALMMLVTAVSFADKVGTPGSNEPASHRGSYTVAATYSPGLSSSYGLAIRDDVENSIWISNYNTLLNYEFNMATGGATGTTWAISSGVDPDDQGYCEYTSTLGQFFFGHWASSMIAVYDGLDTQPSASHKLNIAGPAGWSCVCGVDAGHGNLYASDFFSDQLAWGPYTGVETSVTWSTAPFNTISGLAVYEDYLFACTQDPGVDNIFIFELNADGSPNMTPVWSCIFTEDPEGPNGGLDFDGQYLWVYPQNGNLYKLEIDFFGDLQSDTWGAIKASF